MSKCDFDSLRKKLEEDGRLTPKQINNVLALEKIRRLQPDAVDSALADSLGGKEIFTSKNRNDLLDLQKKISDELGPDASITQIEGMLNRDDFSNLKYLLLKKQEAARGGKPVKTPRSRNKFELIAETKKKIESLKKRGRHGQARRLEKALIEIKRIQATNEKMKRNFEDVNKLMDRKKLLKDFHNLARVALEDMNPGKASYDTKVSALKERLESLKKEADLKNKFIEKFKAEITQLNADKAKTPEGSKDRKRIQEALTKKTEELKKVQAELKIIRQAMNKIEGQLRGLFQELLKRSEEDPASKSFRNALKQVGYEIYNIDREIMKAGFLHEGFIDHVLSGDFGTSARQISADIERAKIDNAARTELVNTLYVDEVISRSKLATVLGSDFVMSRLSTETATKEEADAILEDFKDVNLSLATKKGYLISDLEFARTETLEALAEEAEASKPLDLTDNDTIIIPMISHAEVVAQSNAGVTPEAYADYTSDQVYRLLDKLLKKLHSLRYSPGYGKMVASRHVQAVMADIVGLEHVNGLILFGKDLEYIDTSATRGASMEDRLIGLRSTMQALGYTEEQINAMPEMKNYNEWLHSDKSLSIDIETEIVEGGIAKITTVAIRDKGGRNNSYETPEGGLTAERSKEILEQLEELQNQGYKLLTYNGNSFDLHRLGQAAGEIQLAGRIALRSIDLMQNTMAFNTFKDGSTKPTSEAYKLDQIMAAMEFTDKDGTPLIKSDAMGGKLSWLWAKVLHGQEVTRDNVRVSVGNDAELITKTLEELQALTPEQAGANLQKYAEADAELNLIMFHGDNKKPGLLNKSGETISNIARNAKSYDLNIGAVAPTWNLTGHQTLDYAAMRGMGRFGVEEEMSSALTENIASVDTSAETQIDLDGAIQTVMTLMVRARAIDPETKEFAVQLVKLAEETVTPAEEASVLELEQIGKHREALQKLQQQDVETDTASGRSYPLRFKQNGQVMFASVESDGAAETELRQLYNDEAVVGFKEYLSKDKRFDSRLKRAAEQVDFRPQRSNEDVDDYIKELMIHTVNKYSFYGVNNIFEFGNGMVDYAPAYNVGMGLAQIVFNQREGAIARPHDQRMLDESYRFEKTEKSEDRDLHLSMRYGVPQLTDVHHAMPISLNQIESAFRDFKLRSRMQHILNYDIKDVAEARSIIDYYKGKEENQDEVIGFTRTPMPDIVPNVSNRLPWNNLPNIDQQRALVTESLLEMPQILQMWQHDSVTTGGAERLFLSEEAADRYYAKNALSPGSLTAAALLSGLGPQIAWSKSYPVLDTSLDMIRESVKRGQAAANRVENPWSSSNYFDYKFNGLHHFLALQLQYSSTAGQVSSILEDLGIVGAEGTDAVHTPDDIYNKTDELLEKAVNQRLKDVSLENGQRIKLERIKAFLEDGDSRTAMKQSVIPVLYSGGINAARNQTNKFFDENNIKDVDVNLLTEILFAADTATKLSIIDEALGIDAKKREGLIKALHSTHSDMMSGLNQQQAQKYINDTFPETETPKLTPDALREFLNRRIRYMARILTPERVSSGESRSKRLLETEKEIQKEYQARIDKATDFVKNNDMAKQENKRQVNIILSGNEQGYKQQSTLAAMNVMQRTPFTMRADQIDIHKEITGRYIADSDFLGFQDHAMFFSVGEDSAGQRLYYSSQNYLIQPQNSSLSNVVREGTPDGEDDNPHGMWKLENNNLYLSENPEAEVEKLLAKSIALRLSPSYAPTQMGYDMDAAETHDGFWSGLKERDVPETKWFVNSFLEEQELIAAADAVAGGSTDKDRVQKAQQLKDRKKSGSRVSDAHRFILDPTRDRSGLNDITYLPGNSATPKGLAAFRPEAADIPWAERGIMTLAEVKKRRDIERNREGRVENRAFKDLPSGPDSIIPKEAQGWKNPYEGSDSPYVPQAPVDFVSDAIQGNVSLRIQRRANAMRPRLEEYAIERGLTHLLGDKPNWTKLYVLRELEKKTVEPMLEGFRGLRTDNAVEDKESAVKLNMDRIAKITQLFQFHNDVAQNRTDLVSYGKIIGFSPEELADKKGNAILFVDFLAVLARKGVSKLSPLIVNQTEGTYNIPLEHNLVASGSTTELQDTRSTPLTVQHHDSAQVLFTLLYQQEGRVEAKKYLKERLSKEQYDALDKDNTGFPLLSAVPAEHIDGLLETILDSEPLRNFAIRNMGLSISFDAYANPNLKMDSVQVDSERQLFPNALRGARVDFASTRGGLVYLNNEMINHILVALSNDLTHRNAELVSITGAEFGNVKSDSMKIADAYSRRYYEIQRDGYADEMDMLTYLHEQSGSPRPRFVKNSALGDEYGLPLAVYDANFYVTDASDGFSGKDQVWVNYIATSQNTLNSLGLTAEARVLAPFTNPKSELDYKHRQALVIIAETSHSREDAKKKLQAFLPHSMTDMSIDTLIDSLYAVDPDVGLNAVQAYQIGVSRLTPRNSFVSSAIRFAEENGPINPLDMKYLDYIGVADPAEPTKEERTKANVAARRANQELTIIKDDAMYEGLGTDLELITTMDPAEFIAKFNHDGSEINSQIEQLVTDGVITDDTANFYRAMVGMILAHDNSFADKLSLDLSTEQRVKGSASKLNNSYTITLNPDLLKRVPAPEAIRVFAHELVHIARLKYMSEDSPQWYSLRQLYQSSNGVQAMSDLLKVMSDNDVTRHTEDLRYYTANPDEFIAEFGAYFLMARATNNTAVLTEIENLRTRSEATDKMLSWWERAFKYIKDFANRLTGRLAIVKKQNPEVYDQMLKITDQLFNFDGTSPVVGRKNVNNPDGTFNVALSADIAADVDLTELSTIQDIGGKYIAYNRYVEQEQAGTITDEGREVMESLETELQPYMNQSDELGLNHANFARIITEMTSADGELNPYREDTPEQKQARASLVLRRVGKTRGNRVDSRGTPAGLIRKIFNDTHIDKLQEYMYSNSNQSDFTWNSQIEVLASLAWLLDTTKATTENSFVLDTNKGIVPNKNKIEQLSSSVTRAVNMVRAKHKNDSGQVEAQTLNIVRNPDHEKPSDMSDDMWKDATNLARVYRANHREFIRIAEEAGIRDATRESNDFALRLNKDNLTAEPGRLDRFNSAIKGLQAEKLESQLTPLGQVDPILIYMSGIVPRYEADETLNLTPEHENRLRLYNSPEGANTPQALMYRVLTEQARELYIRDMRKSGVTGTDTDLARGFNGNTTNQAKYINKVLPKLLYQFENKSTEYRSLLTSLTTEEKTVVFDFLKDRVANVRGDATDAQNRHADLHNQLSRSVNMDRATGALPYDAAALQNPSAADVKVMQFMGEIGNSTFVPYLDQKNNIQVEDIYGADRPDSEVIREGFSSDVKQIIRGTQLGIGGRGFVELQMEQLVGVKMSYETLISTIENMLESGPSGSLGSAETNQPADKMRQKKELIALGLKRLRRIHQVSMGVAERYETSGRHFMDALAKYGPNILTLAWGPNLNSASMIFEAQLSALNATMYGGNPVRMYTSMLGNVFSLMYTLRNGSDKAQYNHKLRALGDALYDTNNNVRLLMENGSVQDETQGGWMTALRTYNNVSALAIKMAMMEEGNKFLISNAEYLQPMIDWAAADDTPSNRRDRDWYAKMVSEAGPDGLRQAMGAGFRPELAQILADSELLTKDMVDMLGYVLNSSDIPLVAGMIDLTALKTWIETAPSATIKVGEVEYTRRQFWDLAGNIESFNNGYANLSIVQSDPMDRDVDKNTAWYLLALYRSFPNLFTMQHVMRAGAREGMVPFAVKSAAAVMLDLIYNLFLASLYGLITLEDLDKWRKGEMDASDALKLGQMLARSPFLGLRGNMAASGLVGAVGALSGASNKTGFDRYLDYGPLMAVAGIRLLEQGMGVLTEGSKYLTADTDLESNYHKEMFLRNLLESGRKALPVFNDSAITAAINQAFPSPDKPSTSSRRGGGSSMSPPVRTSRVANDGDDELRNMFLELDRNVVNKRQQQYLQQRQDPGVLPPPTAPQNSTTPSSSPEVASPPSGGTPPAQTSPPPPQTPDSSEGSSRASQPIQPPSSLGD